MVESTLKSMSLSIRPIHSFDQNWCLLGTLLNTGLCRFADRTYCCPQRSELLSQVWRYMDSGSYDVVKYALA